MGFAQKSYIFLAACMHGPSIANSFRIVGSETKFELILEWWMTVLMQEFCGSNKSLVFARNFVEMALIISFFL